MRLGIQSISHFSHRICITNTAHHELVRRDNVRLIHNNLVLVSLSIHFRGTMALSESSTNLFFNSVWHSLSPWWKFLLSNTLGSFRISNSIFTGLVPYRIITPRHDIFRIESRLRTRYDFNWSSVSTRFVIWEGKHSIQDNRFTKFGDFLRNETIALLPQLQNYSYALCIPFWSAGKDSCFVHVPADRLDGNKKQDEFSRKIYS